MAPTINRGPKRGVTLRLFPYGELVGDGVDRWIASGERPNVARLPAAGRQNWCDGAGAAWPDCPVDENNIMPLRTAATSF